MFRYALLALVCAAPALAASFENIALNAPYTLDPNPSYALCSDPGDFRQLTDGVYTTGYFWAQESTVGWANAKTVIITLDLGEVKPIRGVSLNTAAGTAGVAWPSGLRVFVGDADRQFREAGDLLALSAKHGEPAPFPYSVHRYWTDELRTHGRYVAFVITNQPFTFADEIEVYAGDPAWLAEPLPGAPVSDVAAYVASNIVRDAISRRLRQDVAAVREKAAAPSVPEAVRASVTAQLDAVLVELGAIPPEPAADFRAVLPLNETHRRIFAARGQLWPRGLTVWQSPLWGPLSHLADPPANPEARLRVAMMRNEFRAAALNVSNGGPEEASLTLRVEGLPGGVNPPWITVHEVAWTDTAAGVPVASALPAAARDDAGWRISIPAGMTRQVWFTVQPTDIDPGQYEGAVTLSGAAGDRAVPFTLDLYPMRFPDAPSLGFGGWDYTDGDGHRGVNPENRPLLIEHLRKRYVNAPWATSRVIPRGGYDASGRLTAPPDTRDFDAWVARWPDAAWYCIFAAVNNTFERWTMDDPEFDTAVGQWASFWADHARARGIDPSRLAVLLFDEPHAPEHDAIIVAWANAIRQAGAGWTIWEDPTYHELTESQEAMFAACDVICPNRTIFLRGSEDYRDFYRKQRDAGKRLEFYSCSGPSTLLDPYAYYRLQAWTCWKEGAQASYFWAFGDNAGVSPWNEYLAPRNIYTLSFLDDTSVTPAKMMEAAREGVQDYEYFVMLQAAIDRAPEGPAKDAAKRLLEELPDRVLDASTTPGLLWHDDIDRSLADEARIQILDALAALRAI
ncbi:MAG: hypothetical protein KF886_25360 [Candidatus Hydrogenedentes bacterium]|nr:hypothetical protein [Candidatus Hydrogenedentota bacterium]